MERVAQIGIYEYLNEFPLSKDNKVLYFSIFMKRPQFLEAHMEWLYNNKHAFLGLQIYSADAVWSHIAHLNEVEDECYMKFKYSTQKTICRNRSEDCTLEEVIERVGLYSYINVYGGCTTGNKLEMYYDMIRQPKWFDAHCRALGQSKVGHACISLEDIGALLNDSES